ncbi:mycofactocin-coupled SDR family oxidoreductase [[Mycobacterium] vasticus]|uniref:Mycofactocin-coupled SDR family oxidoreductase n=1 Tax=[Mycobacterium] vasticus TaxID=2875777 RepID=A0ABU5YZG9_9MYCO|nr:mycofactocin-coupled SDR family oxidoreductase [Mycolicibacter sp. MYC017]MEB3070295.1 mycofactocin-coupled SDR family oxidoreductase [Mycolicibacter sp. MYC017]
MSNTPPLHGRVAVITGAARGQGRAHAVRLAADGANIIALDVCGPVSEALGYPMATSQDLDETVRLVEEAGGKIVARQADVRHIDAVRSAVNAGLDAFGRIDIVVCNAGIITYGLGWELEEEAFDAVMDVNVKGVWNTVRATVPAMIEAGNGGSIIITSSTGGIRGNPVMLSYDASKHAVVGMMRCLANELGQHSIRVNTVHPTGVRTAMGFDPQIQAVVDKYPDLFAGVGQNVLPVPSVRAEDIANAVAWLASDQSCYVTGTTLPVDAGSTNRA